MPVKTIGQSHIPAAPRSCFIAMPFGRKGDELHSALKHVVEQHCGLQCVRVDDLFGSRQIVSDIWDQIASTRFVIADLSGRNANVFYELGICHGIGKQAILLTESISDVPFDLRDRRCVEYVPERALNSLSPRLIPHIRECISTLPASFREVPRLFQPMPYTSTHPAAVVVTDLEYPDFVLVGQPFEITIKATNLGGPAKQGYFSLSFPDGVDDLHAQSSIDTTVGQRGDRWADGRFTLKYPIAEASRYAEDSSAWDHGHEYALAIQARARRKGLLWFYASSSSQDRESGEWRFDPADCLLELDQRREPVYAATIDVR
jgi:hypothetical protein